MSELRDMTAALQSISTSLTGIEACLAEVVANGVQHREGMHDLRGTVHSALLHKDESEKSVELIRTWIGDFGKKLGTLNDQVGEWKARFETLADEVTQGFRKDRAAIRDLQGLDEVTRP